MITAWDVYWVMQLDTICAAFMMFAFAGIIAGGFVAAMGYSEDLKAVGRFGLALFACGLLAAVFGTFLPSSKTAAAMILVPALTSEQVIEPVSAEARELYTLAKQALANLGQPKAAEQKTDSK